MRDEQMSAAKVVLAGSSTFASIEDSRGETREMFEGLSAEQRDALAFEAWTLGLDAVSNAERAPRGAGFQRVSNAAKPARKPVRLSTIPPSSW